MSEVASVGTAPLAHLPFADWEQTASAHRETCLRVAGGLIRDAQMAEDVVQEAFVAAWEHRVRFDPTRSTQRSWLLMMTHRRAVDRIRAEQRHRNERLALTEYELRNDSGRMCATDPSELLERDEVGEAVRSALAMLPVLQRETLMLAYWGGYTQSEIARLMSCPLGTVKTRCLVGLRRLRLALETAKYPGQAKAGR